MGRFLNSTVSRRHAIQAAALTTVGLWQLGSVTGAMASTVAAVADPPTPLDPDTRLTLEAFADTIVPGEKRFATDVAIAGAASGPSAVVAGAVELLAMPEIGLVTFLPGLAQLLNGAAAEYAGAAGLPLDPTLPPFVALPFEHRTGLTRVLTTPGRPDHPYWVLLATLTSWSFDIAGGRHTVDAIGTHPGLTWIGFPRPDRDGVWRFRNFSYRRRLARISPRTTQSGSPA